MATEMKKRTTQSKTETTETVNTQEKIEVKEPEKKEPKKYKNEDAIPCQSITPGGLYMAGIKTNIVYEWADSGDVTEVVYQDLVAAIRSNNAYITKPYFIIQDKELVEQFPRLKSIYNSMYSIKDLQSVLTDLSPDDMKATILSLPEGAQESIKHIASKMISNQTLDSVRKIGYLDEIFDTKMMLLTEMF